MRPSWRQRSGHKQWSSFAQHRACQPKTPPSLVSVTRIIVNRWHFHVRNSLVQLTSYYSVSYIITIRVSTAFGILRTKIKPKHIYHQSRYELLTSLIQVIYWDAGVWLPARNNFFHSFLPSAVLLSATYFPFIRSLSRCILFLCSLPLHSSLDYIMQ